jgi:hypothetical protein
MGMLEVAAVGIKPEPNGGGRVARRKTAGRMPALPARDAVVVRTWGAAVLRPYMTVQVQNCRRRLGRSGVARGNFVRCVLS